MLIHRRASGRLVRHRPAHVPLYLFACAVRLDLFHFLSYSILNQIVLELCAGHVVPSFILTHIVAVDGLHGTRFKWLEVTYFSAGLARTRIYNHPTCARWLHCHLRGLTSLAGP